MQDAAVYIVPLRIGGGTRLKIFEAMAMGKAVVSTTVGAEGLPVDRRRARAARRRAARRSRAPSCACSATSSGGARLEAAARTLVVERYDWSAVAGELEEAPVRFATATEPRGSAAAASQHCGMCRRQSALHAR